MIQTRERPTPPATAECRDKIVIARGLSKHYGSLRAVDGIDFEVQAGEFFGVLGPNGAGKSTTMRMLYRVTPVTAGELELMGLPAGEHDRAIKSRLGVIPQLDNLDEELDVLENLIVYARFNDIPRDVARQRAKELLTFIELEHKVKAQVRELSGGMRRRLVLARGLMNDPEVVILDEPTTGLDPQVRLTLWDKLDELRARGVTIIMTTHYMDEAERLCDRLVVMDHGKIIAEGSPRALVERHVAPEVLELRTPGPKPQDLKRAAEALGAQAQQAGERLSLFTQDARALQRQLESRGFTLTNTFVRPGNLEDMFLTLTGRSLRE